MSLLQHVAKLKDPGFCNWDDREWAYDLYEAALEQDITLRALRDEYLATERVLADTRQELAKQCALCSRLLEILDREECCVRIVQK